MDINHPDLKYWLGLDRFPKFGANRLSRLNNFFSSPAEVFRADLPGLMAAQIEEKIAHEFITYRTHLNLDQLVEQLIRENINVAKVTEDAYPEILKHIYTPPFLLYYRGVLKAQEKALGVVGTRKLSPYGKQAVHELIPGLARAGLTIVSGLALGIDTLAHSATIETQGRTIAVLGSGINKNSIYPTSNRYLAEKIVATGGCLLSEFSPDTAPLRYHFPMRNRIISGLSLGTLIIEAALESGSLITARTALEQNREVFAVPGSIFSPSSAGTNMLITQGAMPIIQAEQILAALDLSSLTSYSNKRYKPENDDECLILSFLSKEAIHFEELILKSRLPTAQLNSLLMILEVKKVIRNLGGMNYILN